VYAKKGSAPGYWQIMPAAAVITCNINRKICYMNQRALDYIEIPADKIYYTPFSGILNSAERPKALLYNQR